MNTVANHLMENLVDSKSRTNPYWEDWGELLKAFDQQDEFAHHLLASFVAELKLKHLSLKRYWLKKDAKMITGIYYSVIILAKDTNIHHFSVKMKKISFMIENESFSKESWSTVEKIFSDFYFIHKEILQDLANE